MLVSSGFLRSCGAAFLRRRSVAIVKSVMYEHSYDATPAPQHYVLPCCMLFGWRPRRLSRVAGGVSCIDHYRNSNGTVIYCSLYHRQNERKNGNKVTIVRFIHISRTIKVEIGAYVMLIHYTQRHSALQPVFTSPSHERLPWKLSSDGALCSSKRPDGSRQTTRYSCTAPFSNHSDRPRPSTAALYRPTRKPEGCKIPTLLVLLQTTSTRYVLYEYRYRCRLHAVDYECCCSTL